MDEHTQTSEVVITLDSSLVAYCMFTDTEVWVVTVWSSSQLCPKIGSLMYLLLMATVQFL